MKLIYMVKLSDNSRDYTTFNPFATELFFGFDGIKMCYFQLCVGYFVIIFLLF